MSRHSFSSASTNEDGYAAKAATRQATLDLIQNSEYWVPEDGGYLNGDWIELCGEGDETLKMLLDAGALREGFSRYIGVNDSPEVLEANRTLYRAATEAGLAEWRLGTWADHLADFDKLSRVRVIVFDGFNALHNTNIDRILRDSQLLADHLYHRNGAVLLVLNFSLFGRSRRMAEQHVKRLLAWKDDLCSGNRTQPTSTVYTSKVIPMLPVWLPLGF